jgi:hypothetical protein
MTTHSGPPGPSRGPVMTRSEDDRDVCPNDPSPAPPAPPSQSQPIEVVVGLAHGVQLVIAVGN